MIRTDEEIDWLREAGLLSPEAMLKDGPVFDDKGNWIDENGNIIEEDETD